MATDGDGLGAGAIRGGRVSNLGALGATDAGPGALPVWDRQRDHLCGPFVGARLLRERLSDAVRLGLVDQDELAALARTTLPAGATTSVPRGVEPLAAYRVELTRVPSDRAGTAPRALGLALEQASAGQLEAVPVAGPFHAETLEVVIGLVLARRAFLLANLRTGKLWGTRPSPSALLQVLTGQEASGPEPDWDVGHWVEFRGLLRGSGGSMVLVYDTYPTLGFGGLHLQPTPVVAAALSRGDGRSGGLLALGPREDIGQLRADLEAAGAWLGWWDNGTPDPAREEGHGTD